MFSKQAMWLVSIDRNGTRLCRKREDAGKAMRGSPLGSNSTFNTKGRTKVVYYVWCMHSDATFDPATVFGRYLEWGKEHVPLYREVPTNLPRRSRTHEANHQGPAGSSL